MCFHFASSDERTVGLVIQVGRESGLIDLVLMADKVMKISSVLSRIHCFPGILAVICCILLCSDEKNVGLVIQVGRDSGIGDYMFI